MVRKTPSFRATLIDIKDVGGEWIVETSHGVYFAAPAMADQMDRISRGITRGYFYQCSLNWDNQIRYFRCLGAPITQSEGSRND